MGCNEPSHNTWEAYLFLNVNYIGARFYNTLIMQRVSKGSSLRDDTRHYDYYFIRFDKDGVFMVYQGNSEVIVTTSQPTFKQSIKYTESPHSNLLDKLLHVRVSMSEAP